MPSSGLEPGTLISVLAVIAVTHWLGGITAFGSTLLAMPLLAWSMNIQDARTVLLLLGAMQCYQVFLYVRRDVNWRMVGRMMLFAGIGLPIGVCAVSYLPAAPLLIFLGIVLIVSGAVRLLPSGRANRTAWPPALLDLLLLIGGVIHGAFVCGGAALVVYAQHNAPEKGEFRGTITGFWVVINTILVAVLFCGHQSITRSLPILGPAIPLVFATTWLGNVTARRLSQNHFVKLVAVLLIIAGLITVGRVLNLDIRHIL